MLGRSFVRTVAIALTSALALGCHSSGSAGAGGGGGGTSSGVQASSSTGPNTCGDGVIDPGEECDDGNQWYADGCSGECKIEAGWTCTGMPSKCVAVCGDGHVAGKDEQCDDGNTVDGDGCSSKCQVEKGYTCTGTPSVCTTVCGDGFRTQDEECDDGNTKDGDCCSSTCKLESGCEREPNDTLTTANDLQSVSIMSRVHGSISPAGDVDTFRITVPAGNADISAETEPGILGTMCATGGAGIDSRVRIFDASGAVLVTDDDGGVGLCSLATASNVPPGVYYAAVDASPLAGKNSTWDYDLVVKVTPTHCGNGVLDPGEQCDDGNTTNGDGCSSTCRIECSGTSEIEPNDTSSQANGPLVPSVGACGAISPAGDSDVWSFTITRYADVSLETFDASGAACAGIDTVAALLAPDGTTLLAADDDGGIGSCAFIDSTKYQGARHLAPGTYYVRVSAFGSTTISSYKLVMRLDAICGDGVKQGSEECDGGSGCDATCHRIPTCGDGFVDPPEQCDDGNTVSGDGCSSTCQLEVEQVCNDGLDNDVNGSIDCADPACAFACGALTCDAGETLVAMKSADLPQPIVDLVTKTSTLEVNTLGTVKKIAVRFNAQHSYDGDVDLRLAPPGAPAIVLTSDDGGAGHDYVNTVFVNDPNACLIGAASCNAAPFTGSFQPKGTTMQTGFASLLGTPANGTWTITLRDDAPGNQGTWQSFELALCVGP